MIQQVEVCLSPKSRGFHLVTNEIEFHLPKLPEQGILNLFIQHTSAAITINENCDPSVREDFEQSMNHLVKENPSVREDFEQSMNHLVKENEPFYKHTLEGPDDMPAHIKSSLMGFSVSIPITNSQLNLGLWQGVYLCEFRNQARERTLIATIYS